MSALILIAGQSNAITFGVTAAQLPADLQVPNPKTMIWTGAGFETMAPGVNTGGPNTPAAVGPEVEFAARWTADHPGETLYLVKSVKGSTGLAEDPTQQDWSPESRGELFDATAAKIHTAQAWLASHGQPSAVSAILWIQGEQDAADAIKAGAYAPNLIDLFAHMRSAWATAQTPIVFSQLDAQQALQFGAEVRAAQELTGHLVDHAGAVDTDLLTLQADRLHYDAPATVALGGDLYAELLAVSQTSHGPLPVQAWARPHGSFLESEQ